jgi:uncharacterized membrane protein
MIVIAAFTLTLIVLTLGNPRHSLREVLIASTTHQPERLTELYIIDPATLPSEYSLTSPIRFAFTIHNLEYRDTLYAYQILVQGKPLGEPEHVQVSDGAYKNVEVEVPAGEYGDRVNVAVVLVDRTETLHFWVERQP